MPIPKPGKAEDRKDFLKRCMGDDVMVREYPQTDQRYAICNTQWRDRNKHEEDKVAEKSKELDFREAWLSGQKRLTIPAEACCFTLSEDAFQEVSVEGGAYDFRMVGNTGQPAEHWFWGKMAIALEGIQPRKKRLPALRSHDFERIVGWYDNYGVEKDGWVAYGRFAKSTDAAKETAALLHEGFPWQGSIRAVPKKIEQIVEGASSDVNGYRMDGPSVIWRECVVDEVTFTPIGVDRDTSVAALAAGKEITIHRDQVAVTAAEEMTMPKDTGREELSEAIAALTAAELAEIRPTDVAQWQADGAVAEQKRMFTYFDAFAQDPVYARDAYIGKVELMQAKLAYAQKQAEAATKRVAELEALLPSDHQQPVVHQAAEGQRKVTGKEGEKSAKEEFQALVAVEVKAGKTEARAMDAVIREHPELHKAWLKEINA